MAVDKNEVEIEKTEENEVHNDEIESKKSTLNGGSDNKNSKNEISNDSKEDEKMDDSDSLEENNINLQNDVTPTKKNKKKDKSTPKKRKSLTEEDENKEEKKSVKSPSKKKKISIDVKEDDPETEEEKSLDEEKSESSGIDTITKREDWTGYFEKRDHSVNQIYQSEVPQICKDEPCQLGVDEAGRGPVLGPMVYGISYAPLSQKKLLVDLGCADSKSLTEEKRDLIFDKICDNSDKMGYAIDAISPNYIANCMYRRIKTSLNEVSMDSAINLIKKTIEAGVFVTEIYVDTVGKPEKYQLKLELIFPGIKIVVAKKADSTYPIVSAASICAKVSRDHALRAWQFREGENETAYGSGYPNDPATKTWLADNVDPIFGFPQIVRFSWSTAEKILESKAMTVEWEEPEEDSPSSGMKISSFFSASPAGAKKSEKKRNKFFTSRCLTSTTTL